MRVVSGVFGAVGTGGTVAGLTAGVAAGVVASLTAGVAAGQGQSRYEKVFLDGDTVPDGVGFSVASGLYGFSNVGPYIIEDGSVFVGVELEGHDADDPAGRVFLRYRPDGTVEPVFRFGASVAGLEPGVVVETPRYNPRVRADGAWAMTVGLAGVGIDDTNNSALVIAPAGQPPFVAVREGAQAPGVPAGTVVDTIGCPLVADGGVVALPIRLLGPGPLSDVTTAVLTIDPASGADYLAFPQTVTPTGVPGEYLSSIDGLSVADDGTLWIRADVRSVDGGFVGRSLWRSEPGGSVQLLLREGAPAPLLDGQGFGVRILNSMLQSNPSGAGSIYAALRSADGQDAAAVYAFEPTGEVGLAVVTGDPLLKAGPDITIEPSRTYTIGPAGRIATAVELVGPGVAPDNNQAIVLTETDGSDRLLVRMNDRPAGVFGGSDFSGGFSVQSINGRGDVVFVQTLAGSQVFPGKNDVGAWAMTSQQQMHLLARRGESIDVDPTPLGVDLRTIESFSAESSGTPNAFGYGLDEDGRTIFTVRFTDGSSGVFVVAIPEDCIADANRDGVLSPADFNFWIIAFNAQSAACDQNDDGLCTPADFNAWIINFNAGCP